MAKLVFYNSEGTILRDSLIATSVDNLDLKKHREELVFADEQEKCAVFSNFESEKINPKVFTNENSTYILSLIEEESSIVFPTIDANDIQKLKKYSLSNC